MLVEEPLPCLCVFSSCLVHSCPILKFLSKVLGLVSVTKDPLETSSSKVPWMKLGLLTFQCLWTGPSRPNLSVSSSTTLNFFLHPINYCTSNRAFENGSETYNSPWCRIQNIIFYSRINNLRYKNYILYFKLCNLKWFFYFLS